MPISVIFDFEEDDLNNQDQSKLWFANVALLPASIYRKVIDNLLIFDFTEADIIKLIAYTSLYLITDLELILNRITPLIKDILEKRIYFIKRFCEIHPSSRLYIPKDILHDLDKIIHRCRELGSNESFPKVLITDDLNMGTLIKQTIDFLEKIIESMKKNHWLSRWLTLNCTLKYDTTILYHCFLIPTTPITYAKIFLRCDDETVMDKIEYCCFCRIETTDKVPQIYQNMYFIVECIFDPFKGRYMGMLDMMKYIGKIIGIMRYDFKHLDTLAKVNHNGLGSIKSINKDIAIKTL